MSAIRQFLEYDGMIEKQAKGPIGWGEAAQKAAIMTAGTLATYGIMEAVSAAKNAVNRSRGFKEMIAVNPELRDMDAEGVKAMYSMMHKTAPTLAMNPYIAGGFVKRIEHGKNWLDPRIVSDLAETEAKMQRVGYGPMTGFPFEVGKAVAS
jgi:hypothetical protein